MRNFSKQILATAVFALSVQTCHAQWGVAAGAGVEQWNRQRDLDMQEQQLELQRKSMEMDARQFQLEKERRERERRRVEDEQRQHAEFNQKRDQHMRILQEYADRNGAIGRFVANNIRQGLQTFNRTNYPVRLSDVELISLLNMEKEKIEKSLDDELNAEIAKLFDKHSEYKSEKNKAIFREEMGKYVADERAGKVPSAGNTPAMLEATHVRVLARLRSEKGNAKAAQKKVQG